MHVMFPVRVRMIFLPETLSDTPFNQPLSPKGLSTMPKHCSVPCRNASQGPGQPPFKKRKTQPFRVQPVVSQPMKSYTSAKGHVHFVGSSDSDSVSEPESHGRHPQEAMHRSMEDDSQLATAEAAAAEAAQRELLLRSKPETTQVQLTAQAI